MKITGTDYAAAEKQAASTLGGEVIASNTVDLGCAIDSACAEQLALQLGGVVKQVFFAAGGGEAGYKAVAEMDVDEFSAEGLSVQKFCCECKWTYLQEWTFKLLEKKAFTHPDDDLGAMGGMFAD